MEDLRNILPTGKNNAISARELAAKLGVSDRVLRDIVTGDRVKGIVICSSSAGYYLPASKDEIKEFCSFMEKRAKHSFIAIQSARRALGEVEGQQAFIQ